MCADLEKSQLETMKKKLKRLEWLADQTRAAASLAAPAFKTAANDLAVESQRKFEVHAQRVSRFQRLIELPND